MTAATRLAARTVLVADDTAFVRDRFKAAIEAAGHTVGHRPDGPGTAGQVRANTSRIDLIVLDLRIPQGNGVTLLQRHSQARPSSAGIVIFSGTIASADEVRQLETLGVVGYVNEYTAVQHILPSLFPHLFPDASNRRSSPRVTLGIPVAYRFGNTIAAALTINISHGGLAIRTTSPLAVDTAVKSSFPLAESGKNEIDAEARVAWADRRLGMGVQFTRIGTGRPGADRSLRPVALLLESEGIKGRLSFAQQTQRVRDDDDRGAGIGKNRHPERRGPGHRRDEEDRP